MFHGYTEFDRERTLIFVNGENRDSSAEVTHKKDICTNRENRGSFEMDVLIDKRIVIMMKKRKLRLFIHSRDSRISRQFWIFLKFPPCFPAFFSFERRTLPTIHIFCQIWCIRCARELKKSDQRNELDQAIFFNDNQQA